MKEKNGILCRNIFGIKKKFEEIWFLCDYSNKEIRLFLEMKLLLDFRKFNISSIPYIYCDPDEKIEKEIPPMTVSPLEWWNEDVVTAGPFVVPFGVDPNPKTRRTKFE